MFERTFSRIEVIDTTGKRKTIKLKRSLRIVIFPMEGWGRVFSEARRLVPEGYTVLDVLEDDYKSLRYKISKFFTGLW